MPKSGDHFRHLESLSGVFFGANMFAGMSFQILGGKLIRWFFWCEYVCWDVFEFLGISKLSTNCS